MQPVAAQHILRALPPGLVFDPFMGGGTVLIEAMRDGRPAIGADASPLAVFAAAHHTWRPSETELTQFRAQATEMVYAVTKLLPASAVGSERFLGLERRRQGEKASRAESKDAWAALRAALEQEIAVESVQMASPSPAWFCFAAAQQLAERMRYTSPVAVFDSTVHAYCEALRALRQAAPPELVASPALLCADARTVQLPPSTPRVDAILTSPPYAGVYNYMSLARETRARLAPHGKAPLMGLVGTPEGWSDPWPEVWRSAREIGARKQLRRLRRERSFYAAYEADQRAWLSAAAAVLRPGGRAAILIGDGEPEGEEVERGARARDALEPLATAADTAGLRFLASATISAASTGKSLPGKRRPEHLLLVEAR